MSIYNINDWVTPNGLGEAVLPNSGCLIGSSPKSSCECAIKDGKPNIDLAGGDVNQYRTGQAQAEPSSTPLRGVRGAPQDSQEDIGEKPLRQPETPTNSGFDPKLLLGLLGDQMGQSNPSMSVLMNLLNGGKPDLLSLLPLLLQILPKKTPPQEKEPEKVLSLDNFTIIS